MGGATYLLCNTRGQLWYQIKVLMSLNLRSIFGESGNILKSYKQSWKMKIGAHHSRWPTWAKKIPEN